MSTTEYFVSKGSHKTRADGIAPERSLAQRRQALDRANKVRSARSHAKRDVAAGRMSIHDLLDSPPEPLQGARVYDLLISLPYWGQVKTVKTLTRNDISLAKTVGALTERQRLRLHRAVNGGAGR